MSNVTVSVIIPFYNHVDWLIEAVDSVFVQTFTDFEVIVINDGSTEDISVFLEKYRNKIIYKWKENEGPGSARNFGIELAKGKYIAFLDSDDLWCDKKLEQQVGLMESSDAVWSHTSYSSFMDGDCHHLLKQVDLSHFKGVVFPKCLASSPIATPCVMIKNQYLKDNPLIRFSEKMRFGQDWFLWINIAIEEPLFVIPDILTKVRIRGSNASLRAKVQLKAKSQIWEYMKSKPDKFFAGDKINFVMRIAYKMCFYGNCIVEIIEEKVTKNIKVLELIAKISYVLPYFILKSSLFQKYNFKKLN